MRILRNYILRECLQLTIYAVYLRIDQCLSFGIFAAIG